MFMHVFVWACCTRVVANSYLKCNGKDHNQPHWEMDTSSYEVKSSPAHGIGRDPPPHMEKGWKDSTQGKHSALLIGWFPARDEVGHRESVHTTLLMQCVLCQCVSCVGVRSVWIKKCKYNWWVGRSKDPSCSLAVMSEWLQGLPSTGK